MSAPRRGPTHAAGAIRVRARPLPARGERPELLNGDTPLASPDRRTARAGLGGSRTRLPQNWQRTLTQVRASRRRSTTTTSPVCEPAAARAVPRRWRTLNGLETFSSIGRAPDRDHVELRILRRLGRAAIAANALQNERLFPTFTRAAELARRLGDTASLGGSPSRTPAVPNAPRDVREIDAHAAEVTRLPVESAITWLRIGGV